MRKSKSISELRLQIDMIDNQIIKLCLKRIKISKRIWLLKLKEKQSLKDRSREKVIMNAFERRLSKVTRKSKIKTFVRELIALNPDY